MVSTSSMEHVEIVLRFMGLGALLRRAWKLLRIFLQILIDFTIMLFVGDDADDEDEEPEFGRDSPATPCHEETRMQSNIFNTYDYAMS